MRRKNERGFEKRNRQEKQTTRGFWQGWKRQSHQLKTKEVVKITCCENRQIKKRQEVDTAGKALNLENR